MTLDEYDSWQERSLREYAHQHVAAGNWTQDAATVEPCWRRPNEP
jgi:hypothetical protein